MAFQYSETPSGLINSANTIYNLAFTPSPPNSLQLYLNGLLQRSGTDYTLSVQTITFTVAPLTGDSLLAFYATTTALTQGAPSGPGGGQIYSAQLTAQQIINAVSQDLRTQLDSSASTDQSILLDYINRVQLMLLRASRWDFLLSDTEFFITQREQTDYWIGPVGQAPPGAVDTALGLTDVDIIQKNSVLDVTNSRALKFNPVRPYSLTLSTRDAQFRPGLPANYRQDLTVSPNVIQLYPAPDNKNNYQPIPETPYLQTALGGSLAQRTYYVQTTLVDSLNLESAPAAREGFITIPANQLVTVKSPKLPFATTTQGVTYNQYKIYASTTSSGELFQAGPIAIGTDWTEPISGLLTNTVAPPVNNSITMLDGYIITFRYYKQRIQITSTSQILQVPSDYKDIIVHGTNWLASQFLRLTEDAQYWRQEFQLGLQGMVRDRNMIPLAEDYLAPDYAGIGIGTQVPYSDVFDYIR